MELSMSREISIVTEQNRQAITSAVTGAVGGVTPDQASLVAQFFIQYPTTP